MEIVSSADLQGSVSAARETVSVSHCITTRPLQALQRRRISPVFIYNSAALNVKVQFHNKFYVPFLEPCNDIVQSKNVETPKLVLKFHLGTSFSWKHGWLQEMRLDEHHPLNCKYALCKCTRIGSSCWPQKPSLINKCLHRGFKKQSIDDVFWEGFNPHCNNHFDQETEKQTTSVSRNNKMSQ